MTRLTFPRRRIRSIRPDIDPLESISPVSVLIPGLAPTSPALAAEIDAMPSRSRREMEWVGARDRSLALYASVSTPIRSVPASFVPTSRTTLVMSGPAAGLSFDDVSLVGAGASLAGTDGPGACPSPNVAGQSRPIFDGSGASGTISEPIHGARGLSPSHPNLAAADDDGIRPMSLPPPSILDPNGGGGVMRDSDGDGGSGGSGGDDGGDNSGGSGGSGGSGVDVKVFISGGGSGGGASPGWREGDPGVPPKVIQGMQWSGCLTLQGNDAHDYNIIQYQWAFPGSALKGYGNFEFRQERPFDPLNPGTYLAFKSGVEDQSSHSAMVVNSFSGDDLEFNCSEQNDHVIDTFYWGPGIQGDQTISVTATLENVHTGATLTLSDAVTLTLEKVDAPDGIQVLSFGDNAGINTNDQSGKKWLMFDKDFPDEKGIRWLSQLLKNHTKNFNGNFAVTQTIESTTQRTFKVNDQTVTQGYYLNQNRTNPGVMLDVLHAFNEIGDDVQPVGFTGAIRSWDNPGIVLDPAYQAPPGGTPDLYIKSDKFVTTLMYKPWGNSILEDAIWTPVGSLTWSWDGKAKWELAAQAWQENGPQTGRQDSPYATTITFPVWNTSKTSQQLNGWITTSN